MFEVGDIVKCVSGKWYDDVKGLVGTVVKINVGMRAGDIGIDFGVERYKLHTLGGKLRRRTGYYIKSRDLVKDKKSNREIYRKGV